MDIAKYRATHIDDAGFELSDNGQRVCDFVHYNNSNPNVISMGGVQKCKLSNGEWVSPPIGVEQSKLSKLTRDHIRVLLYIFQSTGLNAIDAARALGYNNQLLNYYLDIAVLDHFGIDKAVFVGHSIAGSELSQLGLAYPHRVDKLVYLDTPDLSRGLNPPG